MPITLATYAMGTRFELVLTGDDPQRLRSAGEAALREVQECHHRYNLFDPGSWLNHINCRASHEAVSLDDLTFDLLMTCKQVHWASGEAFDVTVAPLMRAWGFHGGHGSANETAIIRARQCVGMQHVLLDEASRSIRFTRPGITLDLGGIAKGFSIDLAVNVLRDLGVECALLHGGSSTMAAIGAPPGKTGWRVALQTGQNHGTRHPLQTVYLKDQSLSISAPHGRMIGWHDETLGHILDPRTGRPVSSIPYAAAIGDRACETDAWSTALLVLGHVPDTMPHTIRAILPADEMIHSCNTTDSTTPSLEFMLT